VIVIVLEAALGGPEDCGCPMVAQATPRVSNPPLPCYVAAVIVGVRMDGNAGSLHFFSGGEK